MGESTPRPPSGTLPVEAERLLVERAARGDQQAVGLLYDAYVVPLYRFCLARVGNETDAEDLTEEIFIKVMRAVPSFEWRAIPGTPRIAGGSDGAPVAGRRDASRDADGEVDAGGGHAGTGDEDAPRSPFRAWLFRIARNHIVSHYRRTAVRGTAGEVPDWLPDEQRGPAEIVETAFAVREVFEAVAQLPPAQREVIQLRFGAGLTVAETAAALDKHETNVKVLQHKGIKKLRELLEAQAAEQARVQTGRRQLP